jgi:hypothetical protein
MRDANEDLDHGLKDHLEDMYLLDSKLHHKRQELESKCNEFWKPAHLESAYLYSVL